MQLRGTVHQIIDLEIAGQRDLRAVDSHNRAQRKEVTPRKTRTGDNDLFESLVLRFSSTGLLLSVQHSRRCKQPGGIENTYSQIVHRPVLLVELRGSVPLIMERDSSTRVLGE